MNKEHYNQIIDEVYGQFIKYKMEGKINLIYL